MKYIDLGLPSGTLWAEHNEEGYYTSKEAVKKYGDSLPTFEQIKELKYQCKWEWIGDGYKITGPNGNFIILPAAGDRNIFENICYKGFYGFYCSSTPYDSDGMWALGFDKIRVCIDTNYNRNGGFSVRLIENSGTFNGMKNKMKYIDLGLISGTLWCDTNEEGYYTFDEAAEKYGNSLPTREQLDELKTQCKWEWIGYGYKITGHNGNSIVLPIEKRHVFDRYWSSVPCDSDYACDLELCHGGVNVHYYFRCCCGFVRLVKNKDNNTKIK